MCDKYKFGLWALLVSEYTENGMDPKLISPNSWFGRCRERKSLDPARNGTQLVARSFID
jgi:hypothetical protein